MRLGCIEPGKQRLGESMSSKVKTTRKGKRAKKTAKGGRKTGAKKKRKAKSK
jgi:hypothetical protein